MLPIKRSSLDLVGFSASCLICLTLLCIQTVLQDLHESSSIFLIQCYDSFWIVPCHLTKLFSHKIVVSTPRSFFYSLCICLRDFSCTCLRACLCGCLCDCFFSSFVWADDIHFVHMIFLTSLQSLVISLFLCFVKVPVIFHLLAVTSSILSI